jgi:hypothetical protein
MLSLAAISRSVASPLAFVVGFADESRSLAAK